MSKSLGNFTSLTDLLEDRRPGLPAASPAVPLPLPGRGRPPTPWPTPRRPCVGLDALVRRFDLADATRATVARPAPSLGRRPDAAVARSGPHGRRPRHPGGRRRHLRTGPPGQRGWPTTATTPRAAAWPSPSRLVCGALGLALHGGQSTSDDATAGPGGPARRGPGGQGLGPGRRHPGRARGRRLAHRGRTRRGRAPPLTPGDAVKCDPTDLGIACPGASVSSVRSPVRPVNWEIAIPG